MEGLVILRAIEYACALGWHRIICEFDSQIIVNLLQKQKVAEVNWQLASTVCQILQMCSMLEVVSFAHILREWNRVTKSLAKWASKHDDDWKIEGWG